MIKFRVDFVESERGWGSEHYIIATYFGDVEGL